MSNLECPICLNTSVKGQPVIKTEGNEYDCEICGAFLISRTAETDFKNNSVAYKVSAWIREHKEYGRERPKITTYTLEDDLKNIHLDTRQYNHIVWKTPEDLREQLYNTICAVIGKRKPYQEED